MILLSLFLQSCNSKKENDNNGLINKDIKERLGKSYGEGENNYLYHVYGDTVLVYKYHHAEAGAPKMEVETNYIFLNENLEKMEQLDYYKEYLGDDTSKHVTFSLKPFSVLSPLFSVRDENGKDIYLRLFETDYNEIHFRYHTEDETRWKLNHWDELMEWERRAFKWMNHQIQYIDFNKKICRMTSGYLAPIKDLPNYSLYSDAQFTIQIFQYITLKELGYDKISTKVIKEIYPFFIDKHRNIDYLCTSYEGLEALAIVTNREITKAKYPIMLVLKKKN